jgi:hypothetical protein
MEAVSRQNSKVEEWHILSLLYFGFDYWEPWELEIDKYLEIKMG